MVGAAQSHLRARSVEVARLCTERARASLPCGESWTVVLSGRPRPIGDNHVTMLGSKLHVILYVRDQAASAAFYRAALAVSPRLDVPGMTEFEVGGAVLGLMPEEGIVRCSARRSRIQRLLVACLAPSSTSCSTIPCRSTPVRWLPELVSCRRRLSVLGGTSRAMCWTQMGTSSPSPRMAREDLRGLDLACTKTERTGMSRL